MYKRGGKKKRGEEVGKREWEAEFYADQTKQKEENATTVMKSEFFSTNQETKESVESLDVGFRQRIQILKEALRVLYLNLLRIG